MCWHLCACHARSQHQCGCQHQNVSGEFERQFEAKTAAKVRSEQVGCLSVCLIVCLVVYLTVAAVICQGQVARQSSSPYLFANFHSQLLLLLLFLLRFLFHFRLWLWLQLSGIVSPHWQPTATAFVHFDCHNWISLGACGQRVRLDK